MIEKILYYFNDKCKNPYLNIAEEYRLFNACPKNAVLVYLWQNDKTVVIGKNQNIFNEVNLNALYADGGKVARRLTGGGAVYHDANNLNFTFVAYADDYDVKKQLTVICQSLLPFGINAEISGRNDITVDEKKFSGNAFLHEGNKSMHHGTLLIDTDINKMSNYLIVSPEKLRSKGVKSVSSRVVNLKTICPALTAEKLADSIKNALTKVYSLPVTDADMSKLVFFKEKEFLQNIQSKEWLYNRVFDDDMIFKSGRFDWGCVEVAAKICNDVIVDIIVFSDSLDSELSNFAKNELTGKKLSQVAFQNQTLCDIISLLKN